MQGPSHRDRLTGETHAVSAGANAVRRRGSDVVECTRMRTSINNDDGSAPRVQCVHSTTSMRATKQHYGAQRYGISVRKASMYNGREISISNKREIGIDTRRKVNTIIITSRCVGRANSNYDHNEQR